MYRLLIVDDEPIIVDGLVVLFKNGKIPNLEIYEAYSAFEALECLKRTRVDIVLADILMPGMDGIDLALRIRKQWPRCRVIFLTGHENFEYVHAAIRNGAVDYLLKTEHEEEFIKAVEKAIFYLSKEYETERFIAEAEEKIRASLPLLRKEYFLALLHDDALAFETLEKQFSGLEIPLDCKSEVLMGVMRIDDWGGRGFYQDRIAASYAAGEIAEEYLSASAKVFSVMYDPSLIILFMQPREQVWENLALFVSGTLETILDACRDHLGMAVSLASRTKPCGWREISAGLDFLRALMNKGIGASSGCIVIEEQPGVSEDGNTLSQSYFAQYWDRKIKTLEVYLEKGQREDFYECFYEIVRKMRGEPLFSKAGAELWNIEKCGFYYSLFSAVLGHICRRGLKEKLCEKIDISKMFRIDAFSSEEEIVDYFEKISALIFDEDKNSSFEKGRLIARKIKSYVKDHIHEDISLSKLSDVFHYNSFYLSHLFRQVTGESLSEYISAARLSKAKELLERENAKICEVSRAVGLESPSYFTRFFRRCTGMSPQEYRDLAEKCREREQCPD